MNHRKNLPASACVTNIEGYGRLNAPSAVRNGEHIVELVEILQSNQETHWR